MLFARRKAPFCIVKRTGRGRCKEKLKTGGAKEGHGRPREGAGGRERGAAGCNPPNTTAQTRERGNAAKRNATGGQTRDNRRPTGRKQGQPTEGKHSQQQRSTGTANRWETQPTVAQRGPSEGQRGANRGAAGAKHGGSGRSTEGNSQLTAAQHGGSGQAAATGKGGASGGEYGPRAAPLTLRSAFPCGPSRGTRWG